MSNINFDNPYLLLLAIPLVLLVVVPFVIAVRRDNVNVHNVLSLVIHLVLCVCVTLVASGASYQSTMTETDVYVLADLSDSAAAHRDDIDGYVEKIRKQLPRNSRIGVVGFGRDCELLSDVGEPIASVKDAAVDGSATDIASALDYTGKLFASDVIKRIVLITDGGETRESNILSVVEQLVADDVYIDAIYLDSNLKENEPEVQIDEIRYTKSAYVGREETLSVMLRANVAAPSPAADAEPKTQAYLRLKQGETVTSTPVLLTQGYNVVNIPLDTSAAGTFDYELTVETEHDTSLGNNTALFTQKVTSDLHMLFVSDDKANKEVAERLYGDKAEIDWYIARPDVPYTVEALCKYDEIVLADVNVDKLDNATRFLASVETVVSRFGKSLVTLGNTYVQNEHTDALDKLSSLLPVSYGNSDQDAKLLTIVIDVSRSMQNASRLIMAKYAAKELLDQLNEQDMVAVVAFAGDVQIVQKPTPVDASFDVDALKARIDALSPVQGTSTGAALASAYDLVKKIPVADKRVYLVSDGLPYSLEQDTAIDAARKMSKDNMQLFTLNTGCREDKAITLMNDLAGVGSGKYYFAETVEQLKAVVRDEIAPILVENEINQQDMEVIVDELNDGVMQGVSSIESVNGFYYNRAKTSATTVAHAVYERDLLKSFNVPVYAYWNYGSGRVASFSSRISGKWASNWGADSEGEAMLANVAEAVMPSERIDTPFLVETETDGAVARIAVFVPDAQLDASLDIAVTSPDGTTETKSLVFDGERYVAEFAAEQVGTYRADLTYVCGAISYPARFSFSMSYLPEYDRFAVYALSDLVPMTGGKGEVSADGNLALENDRSETDLITYDFAPVIMVIAVILFVADIAVRKLRWEDIKSLFRKKKAGGN